MFDSMLMLDSTVKVFCSARAEIIFFVMIKSSMATSTLNTDISKRERYACCKLTVASNASSPNEQSVCECPTFIHSEHCCLWMTLQVKRNECHKSYTVQHHIPYVVSFTFRSKPEIYQLSNNFTFLWLCSATLT